MSDSAINKEGPPPPYPGPPVVYAYQPAPVYVAPPGSCPVCGGFVAMAYDRTCLVVVIVFGLIFFPFFLGLLCLENLFIADEPQQSYRVRQESRKN
ncbi:hypothetical protein PRIPAC_88462 [Pristionchus pacificus]|uniref:Uncharacterized protein n=1 Tax=Pristionchus pacificus TaxID=54126 RepID=A0A2A6CTH1_PRIPA|nr:hypothetical protein PRIPAC_88462 [Pristionchus pacificus]|eukprot:PDM81524.1 hypothetical protein PRIPAC_35400 [Pristionchus pacificus]